MKNRVKNVQTAGYNGACTSFPCVCLNMENSAKIPNNFQCTNIYNVYLTKKSTETYMTWLLIKYYSIVVSSKLYDKVDSLHLKNSVTSVTFHMLLHFRAVPLEFLKHESCFDGTWPVWAGGTKRRLSHHLCIECFSQLSFDSKVYTKSEAVADFVYTSDSNDDRMNSF